MTIRRRSDHSAGFNHRMSAEGASQVSLSEVRIGIRMAAVCYEGYQTHSCSMRGK